MIPEQNEAWLKSINWTEFCRECQSKHGECNNLSCAKYFYDPWGDEYPSWVYHMDGNSVAEYNNKKATRIEERRNQYDLFRNKGRGDSE